MPLYPKLSSIYRLTIVESFMLLSLNAHCLPLTARLYRVNIGVVQCRDLGLELLSYRGCKS